jgi:phosphoglycolate phosphatase
MKNNKDITAVLFDIDGTLLDMRGAGRKSFILALEHTFGWKDDLEYINFAGNTDLNVLQQIMAYRKVQLTEQDTARLFARIPVELEREACNADLILYPGVRPLLETLANDERAVLGLVTGNLEACARIKLQQFDLHGHFVLGGYGDRFADRTDIARHALEQVQVRLQPGQRIQRCVLVGDTPFDIMAAKNIGAMAIGVATGKFTVDDLQEAGADHVLENLSDTEGVLKLLGLP